MNKRRFSTRGFLFMQKALTGFLLCLFVFSDLAPLIGLPKVEEAEAAQVTIDSTGTTVNGSTQHTGPQTVFIDDQTGYKFYRDSSGECAYSKTTDGGANWGSAVLVDDQGTGTDCEAISVWYDRWTPGDTTGNYIHIATIESGTDDVFYNRIDTANSDTRLLGSTAVNASSNSGQGPTFVAGANFPSITRGTDGTVYISADDSTDSFVVECTTNCNLTTGWTETGTRPQDLANDFSMLVPLTGGSIMLINRDISADDIRTKIWNNTSWSGTWTTVDANAPENTAYVIGMAATVDSSGNVYLAYTADTATLGTDDDIRTARYQSSAWASRTAVLTNDTKGLTTVSIGRDTNNGNIYVAYTGRTTAGTAATGNVYWKSSTDSMGTWSAESAAVNTSAADLFGVDLNISSNQRLFTSWVVNTGTTDAINGDTIADLVPGISVSANGSQTAAGTAAFTNTHIGGSFVLAEQASSRDVTSITISENGTIDGSTAVENIKLLYEMDTTAPYNCASVSYAGTETQFGSTDTNGFSGADGTSAFSGTSVAVSTTSAMCVYVVLDVNDTANPNETLNVYINNPSTDVAVTNSGEVAPATSVDLTGSMTISNDTLTQIHYHWRNDNGSEAAATSRTSGTQDVSFTGYQRTPVRLRMEVSNEGNATSPSNQYRLEYSTATTSCSLMGGWTDVGAADDDINMYNSTNLTDGNNTTNIATGIGGMTDENTTFLVANGGVKDTSSQTGGITLTSTNFVELEYSITASTTADDGNTYCFRLTNAGTPLKAYSVYPSLTITADVNVSANGTQATSLNTPSTNQYVGGQFVFTDGTGAHTINRVTITETGTIDAQTGLDNIELRYDLDTTAPYDCASESYAGGETQFGVDDTDGFSSSNGTSTFTGSVIASTTRAVCMYVITDVTSSASNGQTLELQISNPTTDVGLVSGGTAPSTPRAISGTTNIVGAVLTQTHYHWMNDNGAEGAATSLTGGVQDTTIDFIPQNQQVRLRMQVSNEGTVTSPNTALRLEVGTKVTTCENVSNWTDVGATGGAWDMYPTANLTEGANASNIATANLGAMTDENTSYKASNAAVKDTSSQIATTTFTSTEFLEAEFSVKQTADAAFDATYCFRLTNAGTPINVYTTYPELTTSPERDFEIQRRSTMVSGTSATFTAGVDYTAPASTSLAFVRITNSHYTGAGDDAGGGTQNSDDVTAYISNPENLLTSFTITRPAAAISNTKVSWEIIEFIGSANSDNEMKVRGVGTVTYGTSATVASGTPLSNISDDSDVVIFITGQLNPDTGTANYNTGQSTAEWNANSNTPVFRRGDSGGDAAILSYAVVEFTGLNWKVQRAQHTYTSAGTTETESITAVNSLNRTFIHSQKRNGAGLVGTDEFGHEVWLSSIGAVSFFLESGATTPSGQTSVAWIIENTQTTAGSMQVHRSDGSSNGGAEPLSLSVAIGSGVTIDDLTNASIFANTRGAGTGNLYPRPIASFTIASSTHYELWRSDTGAQVNYRVEVIEWPTAGLAFRQNDYRFYTDDDTLDPDDPWPLGISDLGENTVLTGADEPLGDSEHIRMRMSLSVLNATFPEQSESFKLQYGQRVTTCSAIDESSWFDVGALGSGTIWRAYNAPSVSDGASLASDPANAGELNLAVSDVGGTYEEENPSSVNPYRVEEGEDVEYDWHVQQNGANPETFYCFRMIRNDGTAFATYLDYPQLRTSSFTPRTQNWRFYDDENNETPTVTLSGENVAPTDIANDDVIKLRVTVKEIENIARDDVRFKLQYSEYANFANVIDVVATSTCNATSTWCYFNGGGSDNAVVSTKTLSDADACTAGVGDGCGTHNEGPHVMTGFRHENSAATEYEFTLTAKAPRANAVYYFRLYDVVQDVPVTINTGETYPSLVIEGASLVFDVQGLTQGTVIDGETLDVTSVPGAIAFGQVPFDTDYVAGYRLSLTSNATEGYHVLMYSDQQMLNEYGEPIPPVTGTNASPTNWSPSGCSGTAIGCFGYHTTDGTLQIGSPSRFGAPDSYAALSTSPEEIMYSSIPGENTHDILYKIRVTQEQPAGTYEAAINFLAIPIF